MDRGAPADLTIVTVCTEKHFRYIPLQLALLDSLNPGGGWRMIAVDNSSVGTPRLFLDDPRCTVIAGVPADPAIPAACRGSYHHAAALNAVVRRVATRYMLVLDPDLFVVYRNWVAECLDHAERRRLSFFGVPWHPRWYRKERYVPCVHFLLIDLARVPAAAIDFTPAIAEETARREKSAFDKWLRKHSPSQHARWILHSNNDTGWRLKRDFPDALMETVHPVVDLSREVRKPKHLQKKWGRWLERRLPSRWSFLPELGTYATPSQAPGFGNRPIRLMEPEKFVWRGAPFAFHMRGQMRELEGRRGRQKDGWDHLVGMLSGIERLPSWFEWKFER
jgi:hypothetical protein